MKKIIFGSIVALVFAAIVGINIKMNSQEDKSMTDLSLANVEALASGEFGQNQYSCYKWLSSGYNYLIMSCDGCNLWSCDFWNVPSTCWTSTNW